MKETEQNYLRHAVAKSVKQLLKKHPKQHNSKRRMEHPERNKKESNEHKLVITQVDKGKTVVTIYEQEHNTIINNFIRTNQFTHITQNPLNTYQSNIKQPIKQCPEHTPKIPTMEVLQHEPTITEPPCPKKTT
jgi:hypothetical protein